MSRRLSRLLFVVIALTLFLSCASNQRGAGSVQDHRRTTSDPRAGVPAGLELALMTFNIRFDNPRDGVNGWASRRAMVVDIVREQHADFVGLQEALRSQLHDIGPPKPYVFIGVGRDDGENRGEYSAILYRSDRFAVSETGTFWLSPTPDVPGSVGWGNSVPRICTWGRFSERRTGRPFYVFNTHLDHESQPARALGVELIAERIAARARPDPVFLMGDLNAGEDNPAVEYVVGKADRASERIGSVPPSPQMADTFRVLHPDAKDVGTFNAWTGRSSGPKIDFIFAPRPPATEVLDAAILRTKSSGGYPSDHFPVTARLRLH